MATLYNLSSGTKQEERACSISALRFSLLQTQVTNERALLITNQTSYGNAFQRAISCVTIHFGR